MGYKSVRKVRKLINNSDDKEKEVLNKNKHKIFQVAYYLNDFNFEEVKKMIEDFINGTFESNENYKRYKDTNDYRNKIKDSIKDFFIPFLALGSLITILIVALFFLGIDSNSVENKEKKEICITVYTKDDSEKVIEKKDIYISIDEVNKIIETIDK